MKSVIEQSIKENFKRKFVYFEKQSGDRLCGIHCLNAMVQMPLFDFGYVTDIAIELDEYERVLTSEDINSNPKDVNVEEDGNYNIQVLHEALKRKNIEMIPLKKQEADKLLMNNMEKLEAFIFNNSVHWFAIRQIEGVWFNLDSLNTLPGPKHISEFYLSAFIKHTEENGFTNFLIKNLPPLPPINDAIYKNLDPNKKLVSIDDIMNSKDKKLLMSDHDYATKLSNEMDLVPKESISKGSIIFDEYQLEDVRNGGTMTRNKFNKNLQAYESDLEKAIRYSTQDHQEHVRNRSKMMEYDINHISNQQPYYNSMIKKEDDELKRILEESLKSSLVQISKQLPREPICNEPESIRVYFNYKGNYINRRFYINDRFEDLMNYVKVTVKTCSEIELTGNISKKTYKTKSNTLLDEGIVEDLTFNVKVID